MKSLTKLQLALMVLFLSLLLALILTSESTRAAGPWYVKPGGSDSYSCTSPATACATIGGALNKPGFVEGNTVRVATGVYTGTGSEVLQITKSATLSGGWNDTFTTQNGMSTIDAERARRGIYVKDSTVTIERFTIQNGYMVYDSPPPYPLGGGIYNESALTLENCMVISNTVGGFNAKGAGIYSGGTLSISNSMVRSNVGGAGVGLYSHYGAVTIRDSAIEDNVGESGAVYSFYTAIIITGSTISNNTGTGISDYGSPPVYGNSIAIISTTIRDNSGTGINSDGILSLSNSTISGNRGGGIIGRGTLTLTNSTVSGNSTSGDGGGIDVLFATLTLNNTTVSGNSAAGNGGGIYAHSWSLGIATVFLNNSTIADNTAGYGGGIYNGDGPVTSTLRNTIVAGNHVSASGPDCWGNLNTAGYNLLGDTSDCNLTLRPGDLTNVEAMLGPLEGSQGYHPLLPGSPAVNAGNPAGCADHLGNPLPTDERGFPRFGRCDMGAYEAQPIAFSSKTASRYAVFPGYAVTYTISLRNPGATSIIGIRVTDTLPISLTYTLGSLTASAGSYGYNSGVITWTGSLNAGQVETITFGARVGHDLGVVNNTADISGAGETVHSTAAVNVLSPKWSMLGNGTNGAVTALTLDQGGNLYAGGTFTTAGGVTVNGVARWDGQVWSAMVTGVSGTVSALATDHKGNLYVGGQFTHAGGVPANNIARWNGQTWSALGSGVNDTVSTLAVDSVDQLYAGGRFTAAGDVPADRIAKWNGYHWSALGSGLGAGNDRDYYSVGAIAIGRDKRVYAAGLLGISGASEWKYIAQWDGYRWSVPGDTNVKASALVVDERGDLYTIGEFPQPSGNPVRVAKWDGMNWTTPGGDISIDGIIQTLAFDRSGVLYAGGTFHTVNGQNMNTIAQWDGVRWSPLESGPSDWVRTLLSDGRDAIFIGGTFVDAGRQAANNIARWNIAERGCELSTGAFNFATNQMTVTVDINTLGNLDCLTMLRFLKHHPRATSALKTGSYWEMSATDSTGKPATGYTVDLTLPTLFATDGTDKVCHNAGWTWDCSANSFGAYSVRRNGITELSDWAIGDGAASAEALRPVYLPVITRGDPCAPLYASDFNIPPGDWPTGDTSDATYGYYNGEYRILEKKSNSWTGVRPGFRVSDYVATVDVRNATTVNGYYGIVFGLADNWSQFYTFEISTYGNYAIWRYDPGTGWTSLTSGSSGYLNLERFPNRLKVERNGTLIRIYANGQFLASAVDGSYTGLRHVGLIASTTRYGGGGLDVRFDNFAVYPLGCSAPMISSDEANTTPQEPTILANPSSCRENDRSSLDE